MLLKRSVLTFIVIMIAFTTGLVFLIRGCLSKFDERSALLPLLYFEKNGNEIVFSIIKFEKTTSYSQKNGITSKSITTTYYVQTNDAATGAKKQVQKVKRSRDIKQYPVEVIGGSKQWAWVFIGEPMAYDPFTLEKKADIATLEQVNPQLKGKFPVERRYYEFDAQASSITITASDGTKWKMNADDFKALPSDEDEESDPVKRSVKDIENKLKQNADMRDTLYRQKNRKAVEDYSAHRIDRAAYERLSKEYYRDRDMLQRERDSLQKVQSRIEQMADAIRDLANTMEHLKGSVSFSSMKVNADTLDGRWYGLFAKDEEKEMNEDYFYYRALYKETARRQFCFASYTADNDGRRLKKTQLAKGSDNFLDGGFLLSKANGRTVKVGDAFLVVHKERVGYDGRIMVSLVSTDGKTRWTDSTGVKDWNDWIVTGKKLIIAGRDNEKISSSGEANLLMIIDLATGKMTRYDYFKDK